MSTVALDRHSCNAATVTGSGRYHLTTQPYLFFFYSIPIDLAFVIADSLSLSDLLSLVDTCRSLYNYYCDSCFTHIIGLNQISIKLLLVVEAGNGPFAEFLLDCSADTNVRAKDGRHALHITAGYPPGQTGTEITSHLLTARSNPNLRDRCGRAALHVAVIGRHINRIECLLKYADPSIRTAGPV